MLSQANTELVDAEIVDTKLVDTELVDTELVDTELVEVIVRQELRTQLTIDPRKASRTALRQAQHDTLNKI